MSASRSTDSCAFPVTVVKIGGSLLRNAPDLERAAVLVARRRRSLAALRWDQRRGEEVGALLHQAQRRYAEAEDFQEAAVCRVLRGLFHLEEGLIDKAATLLQAGGKDQERFGRPWQGGAGGGRSPSAPPLFSRSKDRRAAAGSAEEAEC